MQLKYMFSSAKDDEIYEALWALSVEASGGRAELAVKAYLLAVSASSLSMIRRLSRCLCSKQQTAQLASLRQQHIHVYKQTTGVYNFHPIFLHIT